MFPFASHVMRRMKRHLVNFAATVSIALAVVFAGLWVWSHFRDCEFGYYTVDQGWPRDHYLNSSRGCLSYVWLSAGIPSKRTRGEFRSQVFKASRDQDTWSPLWAFRGNVVAVL